MRKSRGAFNVAIVVALVLMGATAFVRAQDRVGPVLVPKFAPYEWCRTLGLCGSKQEELTRENAIATLPNDAGGVFVLWNVEQSRKHSCRNSGGKLASTSAAGSGETWGCWTVSAEGFVLIAWRGGNHSVFYANEFDMVER